MAFAADSFLARTNTLTGRRASKRIQRRNFHTPRVYAMQSSLLDVVKMFGSAAIVLC
jgi:hypothetical protein